MSSKADSNVPPVANMPPVTPELLVMSALLFTIANRERAKGFKRNTLQEIEKNLAQLRAMPFNSTTAPITRAASAAEAFIGTVLRQVQAG